MNTDKVLIEVYKTMSNSWLMGQTYYFQYLLILI